MKKKIYIKKALPMLCAVALGSALASCSLETDDAGNLGGMWHMVSVDTLATGGVKMYRLRADSGRYKVRYSK